MAFVDPEGVPSSSLGSYGAPLGDFLGSLDLLLSAVGCLGGPLGIPGGSWVVPGRFGSDFSDFPGNSGGPFGSMLVSLLVLYRFCIILGLIFD